MRCLSEETGLITYVEAGDVRRNVDTTQMRRLLLDAMDVPMVENRRETRQGIQEAETDVTVV